MQGSSVDEFSVFGPALLRLASEAAGTDEKSATLKSTADLHRY
jgi:hypothetical protein